MSTNNNSKIAAARAAVDTAIAEAAAFGSFSSSHDRGLLEAIKEVIDHPHYADAKEDELNDVRRAVENILARAKKAIEVRKENIETFS